MAGIGAGELLLILLVALLIFGPGKLAKSAPAQPSSQPDKPSEPDGGPPPPAAS